MRESGFINSPSSRTPYDFSQYTKITLGIKRILSRYKVGNQILEFENINKEDNVPNVAKCVQVLMRAIHHLEVFIKVKVVFSCDAAAAKRKFLNLPRNVLTQIRAIGSQAIVPKQGNIQRLDGNIQAIDNTTLPR
ncbi:hypothetical protein KUTeg_011735, partial [Tegillarca granosa]